MVFCASIDYASREIYIAICAFIARASTEPRRTLTTARRKFISHDEKMINMVIIVVASGGEVSSVVRTVRASFIWYRGYGNKSAITCGYNAIRSC